MEEQGSDPGPEPSDEQLMARIGSGETAALETLVARHRERAYQLALGLIGDPAEATDISQEAFIRVYRSARRFRADRKFAPWFHRILRNRALTRLKQRAARRETDLDPGFPFEPEGEEDRDSFELRRAVWTAINKLPASYKEIIVLRHFQGLSYFEMAELLSVPAGTVMSRLHTARRLLRGELGDKLP